MTHPTHLAEIASGPDHVAFRLHLDPEALASGTPHLHVVLALVNDYMPEQFVELVGTTPSWEVDTPEDQRRTAAWEAHQRVLDLVDLWVREQREAWPRPEAHGHGS